MKYGKIFVKNETLASMTGLKIRTVSHHLGVLAALKAPGIENCPLLERKRKSGNPRHAWDTYLPFLATLLEYGTRVGLDLKNCKQADLEQVVEALFPAHKSAKQHAYYSASRLSDIVEELPVFKPEKNSLYNKELSCTNKKTQQTPPPKPVPAVVVSPDPEIKKPEPPPEHKPYFELFSDMRLAELAATLKLNTQRLVQKAVSCAVHVKDFKALIEYVYDRWLKGLVKNSPMAYILGTLPNYVAPPVVYDYQVEAAEKAAEERRHDWKEGAEKKTRTAILEQRLLDDPSFSRCAVIADKNYAPLSVLVETWQEHNTTDVLPNANALEALLETAQSETPSPLVFANVFENVVKRHCRVKN